MLYARFLIIPLFLGPLSALAADVSFSPASDTATVGTPITLTIAVNNVSDLFSVAFDLQYDQTKLDFVSAQKGAFLEQGGATTNLLSSASVGKLTVGYSRQAVNGISTGINGSGNLMTIIFNPLVNGTVALTFQNNALCSSVGYICTMLPSVAWNSSTVTIGSGAPSCTESWSCSAWSSCSNSVQTKTCTDLNACGTTTNKPATTQSCTVTPPPPPPSGGGGGGGSVPSNPILPPSVSTVPTITDSTTTLVSQPASSAPSTLITISNPPSSATLTPVQIRNLQFLTADNMTALAEQSTIASPTLSFKALAFDTNNNNVRLEIELRKNNETFTYMPTITSDYVESGKAIILTTKGLTDGSYKFQARVRKYRAPGSAASSDDTSAWLPFGSPTVTDFTIASAQIQQSKGTGFSYYFTLSLRQGLKNNEEVKNLQKVLFLEGVYPDNVTTGTFGPLTKKAVIKFQTKYRITPASGNVGSLTRGKLNELYHSSVSTTPVTPPTSSPLGKLTGPFAIGMKSDQVKLLQQYLAKDTTIYPEAVISGTYDKLTQKAVERFQCKYAKVCEGSPTTNGYGLAGPGTRAKMMEVGGGSK